MTRAAVRCAFFISLIVCHCSPEWKLSRAVERYRDHNPESREEIAETLLDVASVDRLSVQGLESNGRVLYTRNRGEIIIRYPEKTAFETRPDAPVCLIDRNDRYTIISEGSDIRIYRSDGTLIREFTPLNAAQRIRAILLDGHIIYYYCGQRIRRYDIAGRNDDPLTQESFPPPYDKWYFVDLRRDGPYLMITAGAAGSYFGSIVDVEKRTTVLKQLPMASSRCRFRQGALYYITGSAGKWDLVRLSIADRSKERLASFSDIDDIHLASGGYLVETGEGLRASYYKSSETSIPFAYECCGVYRDRLLLMYRDTTYVIDLPRFLEGLAKIRAALPSL